jgi:ribosomal protein S18 acetylase RimI-like enzyme
VSDTFVRRAEAGDVRAVAALFDAYRQFYRQPPDAALAARFIGERLRKGESIVFIGGAADQEPSAFVQLYPTFCSVAAAPILVLYDLFVAPAARRLGLGRALLLAAEAHARAGGYVRMDLSTAKDNVAAQALYESVGWTRDDVFFVYNRRLD